MWRPISWPVTAAAICFILQQQSSVDFDNKQITGRAFSSFVDFRQVFSSELKVAFLILQVSCGQLYKYLLDSSHSTHECYNDSAFIQMERRAENALTLIWGHDLFFPPGDWAASLPALLVLSQTAQGKDRFLRALRAEHIPASVSRPWRASARSNPLRHLCPDLKLGHFTLIPTKTVTN